MAPLIGLSACLRHDGDEALPVHSVPDPYVAAIVAAGGLPVLLPVLGAAAVALLGRLDGLLLTGSPSNVAPEHYGAAREFPPLDRARDATTLALIPAALAAGLPLLAICRGMQELNVALGGSLDPETGGHHADPILPLAQRWAPAHAVDLAPDGRLSGITGCRRITVNSLHGQSIARLAPGLTVEARAADGVIEAVSVEGCAFALGVQWHPEWQPARHPANQALLAAFIAAARRHA